MDEGWDPWGLTIDDVKEVGDRVLIEATLTGRSSLDDIGMSRPFWVVWEVRDGRGRAWHRTMPSGSWP